MLRTLTTCINDSEVFRDCWGARIAEHILLHVDGTAVPSMALLHHLLYRSTGLAVLLKEKVYIKGTVRTIKPQLIRYNCPNHPHITCINASF